MYNPFPYDDPRAVNKIPLEKALTDTITIGLEQVSAKLVSSLQTILKTQPNCILSLDGYISAPFSVLTKQIGRHLVQRGIPVSYLYTSDLFLEESVLEQNLETNLPKDTVTDPPLLYGRLFDKGYEALMDETLVAETIKHQSTFKKKRNGSVDRQW